MKRLALLAALLIGATPVQAEVATVFSVTGSPKLRRGADAEATVQPGMSLDPGDLILTDGAAAAKILMKDRSVVDVSANTSFRIEALEGGEGDGRVEIRSDLGQVRASVNRRIARKGKFLMKTPSSVMAVRGTEFVVSTEPARESVIVLAGAVEVSDPSSKEKPVMLERGRSLEVHFELARQKVWDIVRQAVHGSSRARKSQQIRTLDDAELALLLRRSRLVERNFAQLTRLDQPEGGRATAAVARTAIPVPLGLPRGPSRTLSPTWRR